MTVTDALDDWPELEGECRSLAAGTYPFFRSDRRPIEAEGGVSRKNGVLSFNRLKEPAVDRWPAAVAHSPAGASEPASRRRSLTLSAEPARAEPIVHFPLQLCLSRNIIPSRHPFLARALRVAFCGPV